MKRAIREYGKTVIFALLIGLLITGLIRPTVVKGYSMYPTIQPANYLIINKVPYIKKMPEYGDIVVFDTEIYTAEGEGKKLIKRVIGLPGDVLEIRDGVVIRNGEALVEDYVYGKVTPGEMEATRVQTGCIFVMGDNRPTSLDSRNPLIGQVPMGRIMGRVDLRLYPFDEIGVFQ